MPSGDSQRRPSVRQSVDPPDPGVVVVAVVVVVLVVARVRGGGSLIANLNGEELK